MAEILVVSSKKACAGEKNCFQQATRVALGFYQRHHRVPLRRHAVPVRVLKRGNQRSEALFYKLPNLCKSLKVNQAPKPPETFFGVFFLAAEVKKTKMLNMALQIFEHVFPNFWCFDLLFPYACVRIDGRVGGHGGVGGHDIHRLETWIPCVSRLGSLKFDKIYR